MIDTSTDLKADVKGHWEVETCGTRYADDLDRNVYFEQISAARYSLEPYIKTFADFKSAAGKQMLEIGVGAGADFENWSAYATHATGVDLTERAIELTSERMALRGIPPQRYTLRTADAENLPFPDASFDLVYSWGVLHHTPNTRRAFEEVSRVLRPGGSLKAMIYHVPSWTAFMLYVQHGLLKGKPGVTMKRAVFDHLESPGTKAYRLREARAMLVELGFADLRLAAKLGPGDLLQIKPSRKYEAGIFKLVWKFYPRWLVRLLGDTLGLNLLIEAVKPGRPA